MSLLNSCLDSDPLSLQAIQVLCGLLKVIDRPGQVSLCSCLCPQSSTSSGALGIKGGIELHKCSPRVSGLSGETPTVRA